MAAHDEQVEKVARAIYAASPTVWHESVEPTTMVSPAYQRVTRPIPWNELLENAKSVSHEASAVNEIRSLARAAIAALGDGWQDIASAPNRAYWLIERNDLGAPQYRRCGPGHDWTEKASEALQFARWKDAHCYIYRHEGGDLVLKAVEHADIASTGAQP